MPRSTPDEVKARGAALNAARAAVGLTEQSLQQWAAAGRKESVWIAKHLDAVAVNLLAARAWATLACAIFEGGPPPKIPRRENFRSIEGPPRNATSEVWQGITLRGQYSEPSERSALEHRGSWERYDGPLVLVWNAARGKSRQVVIPLKLANPGTAKGRREAHALTESSCWRGASVVRTWHKGKLRFELHLLVEKPAYVPEGRYDASPRDGRVGVDIGISSAACASVQKEKLAGALLINRSVADRETDKVAAQRERRLQRAMDRSLRATNQDAFQRGSSKKGGRAGAGCRKPGARLRRSKAYQGKRAELAETRRVRAAERERRINEWAVLVVANMGRELVVESVRIKNCAKLWGTSISAFAPSLLVAALKREALKAGGSFMLVETRTTKLSQACICAAVVKKPLSQRVHTCTCPHIGGARFHRDLFSAFLHTAVRQENIPAGDGKTRDFLEASTARLTLGPVAAAERLLGVAASRPGSLITADMLAVEDPFASVEGSRNRPRQRSAPRRAASGAVATQPCRTLDPTEVVSQPLPSGTGLAEGRGKSATAMAGTPSAARKSVPRVRENRKVPVHSDG
jgi:hypothetical protein